MSEDVQPIEDVKRREALSRSHPRIASSAVVAAAIAVLIGGLILYQGAVSGVTPDSFLLRGGWNAYLAQVVGIVVGSFLGLWIGLLQVYTLIAVLNETAYLRRSRGERL